MNSIAFTAGLVESNGQAWSLGLEVSVSRRCFGTSRSRFGTSLGLGLGPQGLVLQAHFQLQKFTAGSTGNSGNQLSVGVITTAYRARSLRFFSRRRLTKFMYYQALCCLVLSLYFSVWWRRCSRSRPNVNMTESEASYSLVQVNNNNRVDTTLNFMSATATCNEVRQHQQQQQQLYSPCQ